MVVIGSYLLYLKKPLKDGRLLARNSSNLGNIPDDFIIFRRVAHHGFNDYFTVFVGMG